jgi:hypothetical protein
MQEIRKLEDLIPYRDSLVELWAEARFQPVLTLLSSLYKEAMDEILMRDYTAEHSLVGVGSNADSRSVVWVATKTAQAKVYSTLFNLPVALEEIERNLEKAVEFKKKMVRSTEKGGI